MTLAANLAALARRAVGLSANNLVALGANGKLPAVPGDQLTGIGRKLISSTIISAAASADIVLPAGFSKFEVELLGHTGNNYMQIQARLAGAGAVMSGAADYKGLAQARFSGVVTYDGAAGASSLRLINTNITWADLLIGVDNLSGLVEAHGWSVGASELTAMGRIQTAGPYDLLRLTPNTGTLTCTCKLFGIKDAS